MTFNFCDASSVNYSIKKEPKTKLFHTVPRDHFKYNMSQKLTFPADLTEVDALVVKHLDAVRPVIRDENLLPVVDHHAIGKLQVLGAAKLVEDVAALVEDDHAHHLALHHDDAALVIHGHPAGMLQDVGTKFPHKLSILVVNLDLQLRI